MLQLKPNLNLEQPNLLETANNLRLEQIFSFHQNNDLKHPTTKWIGS